MSLQDVKKPSCNLSVGLITVWMQRRNLSHRLITSSLHPLWQQPRQERKWCNDKLKYTSESPFNETENWNEQRQIYFPHMKKCCSITTVISLQVFIWFLSELQLSSLCSETGLGSSSWPLNWKTPTLVDLCCQPTCGEINQSHISKTLTSRANTLLTKCLFKSCRQNQNQIQIYQEPTNITTKSLQFNCQINVG